MDSIISTFKEQLGITLEPRGRWHYPQGAYQPKETMNGIADIKGRMEGSSWEQFPHDNMAGFFLRAQHKLVVIDVDGCIIQDNEDGTITLPEIGLHLPQTFHTITSNPTKSHHYYSLTVEQQQRLLGRQTKMPAKVDVFTFGSIFEGHPSEFQATHAHQVAPLTEEMLVVIESFQSKAVHSPGDLTVSSQPQRYHLTLGFIEDSLDIKPLNKFYRLMLGEPSTPRTTKIDPNKHYTFNYDLMNAFAVRLTTTAELDYDEHVLPALNKVLEIYGIAADSRKTQERLFGQILRALPKHPSITQGSLLEELDIKTLLRQQSNVKYNFIVKVPHLSKVMYLDIDRYSLEPVVHGDEYLMTEELAKAIHPERSIVSEDGRVVGWDSHTVPVFYKKLCPYSPQYELDPETYQHTVNLFIPTIYQKECKPTEYLDVDNIVYKQMSSTLHPNYLPLMMLWHAHVIFGNKQLNIIPWIATPSQTMGGTGKTQITGSILTKLIGAAIVKVDENNFMKSWKDMGDGVRSVSLQDFGHKTAKAFAPYHTKMKQLTDPMFEKLDGKYAGIATGKQTFQLSGTSNERIPIPASDRRIFALEAAHILGETKSLTKSEAREIDQMLKNTDGANYKALQDYMNHLKWLYDKPLEDAEYDALFIFTPQTHYHKKWVAGSLNNGAKLPSAILEPAELMNIVKYTDADRPLLISLLEFILHAYIPKTKKLGIPYNWFKDMLHFVLADQYTEVSYSVSDISNIIKMDFKLNVGSLYYKRWREELPSFLPEEMSKWAQQGIVMELEQVTIDKYVALLVQLKADR